MWRDSIVFKSQESADELLSELDRLQSFGQCVLERLQGQHSDKLIYIDDTSGRQWTGAALRARILSVACALLDKHKLERGSVVCVNYEHNDLSCILALGVLCAGGSLCYLGLQDPHAELMYVARKVEPKLYAGYAAQMHKAQKMETDLGYSMIKINMDGPEESASEFDFQFLFNYPYEHSESLSWIPVACKDLYSDITFITMSSGTTGMPKAVPASHANLICETMVHLRRDYSSLVRVAAHSPLDYVSGRLLSMSAPVVGFTAVIINNFDLDTYARAIERHKINVSFLGAAAMQSFISYDHLHKYDLSSLVSLFPMGAKVLYAEELLKFCQKYPNIKLLRRGYGASEFSGCTGASEPPHEFIDKVNGCGKLRAGIELKVVDLDSGRTLGPNQKGMIHIRSKAVFPGYCDMERARKEAAKRAPNGKSEPISLMLIDKSIFDSEGFYITGDIGWMSDEGELHIEGRTKEVMSCIGAKKVLPHELETLIQAHPAVHQVCVIGVKSKFDIYCDCPRAFIVAKQIFYDRETDVARILNVKEPSSTSSNGSQYKGRSKLCSLPEGRRRMIAEDINRCFNEIVSVEKRLIGGTILIDNIPALKSGKLDKRYLRGLTTDEVEIFGDQSE